jgi:hypothetical protein
MKPNEEIKYNQGQPDTAEISEAKNSDQQLGKISLPKKVKWEIIGYVIATVFLKATILFALDLPGDKLIGVGTIIRYFLVYFIVDTYYQKDINTKYAKSKNLVLITFGVFIVQLTLGELIFALIAL